LEEVIELIKEKQFLVFNCICLRLAA